MSYSFEIAAYGWQQKTWLDRFYPEGLPKEWRFSYYTNEYTSVLIPASYWQEESFDLEEWIEEAPDRFRFSFELTVELQQHPDWSAIQSLMYQYIDKIEALLLTEKFDINQLKYDFIQRLALFVNNTNTYLAEPLNTNQQEAKSIALSLIHLPQTLTPIELKKIFDDLLSELKNDNNHLLVYIEAPESVLKQMQTMQALLGL